MEPGILPIRIGGLGNQLFIVVASYITAKVKGLPLYLVDMRSDHQTVEEDYKKSIFSFFGIHVDKCPSFASYTQYSPGGFSPWHTDVSPGTAMSSYFQYYPPMIPYEDEIRELLLRGLRTQGKKEHAFVHVRRGDYLNNPHIHYIQPLDYFRRAMEYISAKKVLVFSDDIAWVEAQDFFRDERFELIRDRNEIECLSLMSLCTEGAVCSNSTFSWWGAYLGAYAKRSPVIVPAQWINPSLFATDHWPTSGTKVPPLFPKEWIILP